MGRRRTRHIAILAETNHTFNRTVVQAVAEHAETFGSWMLLVSPHDRQGRIRLPAGWSGDGIITRLDSRAMAAHVRETGVPAIDFDTVMMEETWLGRVCTDDAERARLALEHFLDRGFEHFAYFAPRSNLYSPLRGRAFQSAVEAAGHPCAIYRPDRSKLSWEEQQRLVSQWLYELPRPVAVFSADAQCGHRLREICQWIGIRVPDEVAILAGSTDEMMCNVTNPHLSSVELASHQVGHAAAALLEKLMNGARVPQRPTLVKPLGVITRQSTDVMAAEDEEFVIAIRFIRNYASHGINVSDVLEEVAISRRSLEQRFRKMLGRSPAEEIRRVRLEKAKDLLIHSDLSIAKVATAAGFLNAVRLDIAFRKEFDQSPLRYRQQAKLG